MKGFTLIETLVAISILLISLAGPLSIAAQSIRSAYYARDEVTASYLAEEGVEYVRAIRDQNYLTSASWLNGLSSCIDHDCTVDFPNFTAAACSGTCAPLIINNAGLYVQGAGDPTPFTRVLNIHTVPGAPDEVIIEVTVSWNAGTIERHFSISEHLFNWL